MNYDELLDIVKTGEGYTIELKASLNSSIGKEICSFANSSGGKIILGVDDENQVKGYNLSNSDKSKIQDITRNMNPSFSVQIEQIKDLVIIYVPEGKNKPYTVNGHFYLRQGANSQQLNRDEIRHLFQKENLISFEKQTNNFDENDFSKKAFENFRNKSNLDKNLSKEHILKNLNLLTNNQLNNAGILFFSHNVIQYIPTGTISCFLYSDKEQVDIIDSKEFDNDLISNLESAHKYVISKINTAIIIKDELKHKTKLELPTEALREAITNAIIHKDYFVNSSIQINISPDKVEIINPGRLLFDKKELGKTSVQRNHILVDLIHRLGLAEKAGSGIKRIKKLIKEENLKVSFETESFFRVIFHRPIVDTRWVQSGHKQGEEDYLNPAQIRHKSSTNPAQIRHKWIVNYLNKNKRITNSIITTQFSINRDTAREDLNKLKSAKKIIKKGAGNNVWYELN